MITKVIITKVIITNIMITKVTITKITTSHPKIMQTKAFLILVFLSLTISGFATHSGKNIPFGQGPMDQYSLVSEVVFPNYLKIPFIDSPTISNFDLPKASTEKMVDAMIEFTGAPCLDSLLTFTVTSDVPLVEFAWDYGNNTTSTGPTGFAFYQEEGIYTIQFNGQDENGSPVNTSLELEILNCDTICADTANIALQIDGELCIDSTITISAVTENNLVSYTWFIADQDALETPEVMTVFVETGNYSAIVVAFDSLGCEYRASSNLFIEDCPPNEGCKGEFPNVFTPNQDEINDFFGIYSNCTATRYELKIYNRWGKLIFESNDPDENWNGTYQDKPAPSEVYLWQAIYELPGIDGTITKTGDVTLVR
ncbi:MAG: hypothetical protein DHS20C18_51620 [Saprospiraceae bacterium]|nr:MAG: hypothetical protein DHS20C18_51620 [Saprospiraceae bacterium]